MKLISFNVNSIRSRIHQLEEVIRVHNPDIIGLQETKVQDKDFPHETINALGYHATILGQKSYHGVAVLTKIKPEEVILGFPEHEPLQIQARLIQITLAYKNCKVHIFNGYFPQGESINHPDKFPFKCDFYKKLTARVTDISKQKNNYFIIMGDMNISHTDLDIGIGEANKKRWLQTGKCSFLPIEREMLGELFQSGDLIDAYREIYPTSDKLSWFDYRSAGFKDTPKRGLRIDLFLVSKFLQQYIKDSDIDLDIRAMDKPSDHAPVWLDINLESL